VYYDIFVFVLLILDEWMDSLDNDGDTNGMFCRKHEKTVTSKLCYTDADL